MNAVRVPRPQGLKPRMQPPPPSAIAQQTDPFVVGPGIQARLFDTQSREHEARLIRDHLPETEVARALPFVAGLVLPDISKAARKYVFFGARA